MTDTNETLWDRLDAAEAAGDRHAFLSLSKEIDAGRDLAMKSALLGHDLTALETEALLSFGLGIFLSGDDLSIAGTTTRIHEESMVRLVERVLHDLASDSLRRRFLAAEFAEYKAFADVTPGGVLDRAIDQALDTIRPYLPEELR